MRRILGNLGFLLAGRAAAGLLSLVYMVIAARELGPTDYGVLVLVHGYVLFIGAVVGFPGWQAIVRYGGAARERNDTAGVVAILRFTGAVELLAGAGAVGVAAGLASFIGPRLGWSAEAQAFAVPYSFALLGSVRTTPTGFLQLARRFDLLALHSTIAPGVRLMGAIVVAWAGFGLKGFMVAWLIAALVEWVSLWVIGVLVARQLLTGPRLFGVPSNLSRSVPGLSRFMIAANADATFTDSSARLAPLVIGWVLGPALAGLFAVAQRATVVLAQPAQVLGQAAYAELATLVASGGRGEALRHALLRCIAVAVASAVPVLLVLAFFSRDVSVMLGGPAFRGAAPVMIWLALARTTLLIAPACSAALMALGRPGLSVSANAGFSLSLLPFLPLLVSGWGLIGAGIHAVLQATVTTAALVWLAWRTSGKPQSPVPAERLDEFKIPPIEPPQAIDLN